MIRKLSIILCMCLFLFACKGDKPLPDYFGSDQPAREFVQSEEFSVTLSPEELAQEKVSGEKETRAKLRETARDKGMKLVLREYVNDAYLLEGGNDDSMLSTDINYMDFSGRIDPKEAPVTGDFSQKFRVRARMTPDWKLVGKIVKLEDDRYVASYGDRCTVVPIEFFPSEEPAYFLVARPVREMNKSLLRVIGSGKLIHPATRERSVTVDRTYTGNIVQVELLETSEEIMKGDVVIWLQAELTALPNKVAESVPTDTPDMEEVIVEPEFRETEEEPKETK
ncbi:MAG: hypothetical protein ACLFSY_04350 [Desulfonatronovibrionaceae bacterium]